MKSILRMALLAGACLLLFCPAARALPLQEYDGGFFSVQVPRGWEVITAGSCTEFAFLLRDPGHPQRMAFFFGAVGPLYLSEQQKIIDAQYMSMGGYPVAHYEMPAVAPFTPENFLAHFSRVADTSIARAFMPACPRLAAFRAVSSQALPCPLAGGATSLVRGLFLEGGALCEGLFQATTVPLIPVNGGPGAGIGYAYSFMGVAAEKEKFAGLVPDLTACLKSFALSPAYVSQCLARSRQAFSAVLENGKKLSAAGDAIMSSWEKRNRSQDVTAEKYSDAILGTERLYDPDTGRTYSMPGGFYDKYDLHRGQYEMNNLKLLTGNEHELWTRPPLDGELNIR